MSRSHKSKRKSFRNIKNSFIKKILKIYSEDIYPKSKLNIQGKQIRARLKALDIRERL